MGDTLGEGAVYEAINFAILKKAPVLFYIEVNGVAQSTIHQQRQPPIL